MGGRAAFLAADVTRRAEVEALVAGAVAEFGALHVMVNNAGVLSAPRPAVEKTEAEWQQVIAVDLTGVWFGCQAALRQLIRQGQGGRIINISARLALQGVAPGRADYCAAKGGVSSLTRQLAVEAGPHGIAVNAICPGFIVTDATRELAAAGKLEEARRRTPYHRLGRPEDVAGCAVFLASAESEFVTGQNLVVDGGASIAG
jgi:3-oxoacyl-[acyl-carrier protein] reductase